MPSVDQLLASVAAPAHAGAVFTVRRLLDRLRAEIAAGLYDAASLELEVQTMTETLSAKILEADRYSLRPVINATGVILHTNLGRAPLSERALDHIKETAGGYCNLEFDIESGIRGRRERIVEKLFARVMAGVTGIRFEDLSNHYLFFVANNCAGAVFLTLHALAGGGEVVVSRGELPEIGGGFRLPEILARAGAVLREVGTTNKTRLEDYENAITDKTKLILRMHRSNFRISGFTEQPELAQLVRLGRKHGIPVVEDQGTGLLSPPAPASLRTIPTFPGSVQASVDVITASGDKLLGGPQAGLIFGRRKWMERISRNPLARAFRVDKLTLAALEATLLDYATGAEATIPVLRMMNLGPGDILRRAEALAAAIRAECLTVAVCPGHSVVGGGAAPGSRLRTHLVKISHRTQRVSMLMKTLRDSSPGLIARVAKDHLVLDLRTVAPELDSVVAGILNSVGA